jgi:RNA polymerase sigma factor (sigma-70 family)
MAVAAADRRMLGLRRDRAEWEFEQMYRRHAGDVFRYSLLVLRSRPDAEDVTQATFVRAYRAMQRGERVRKPQNWLIKIAHNECRRYLRTVSRRSVEVELDPTITEAPETDGPSAEEIRQALSHLSFNQRAALVMRELEDRSYAEIADVLDVSVSAVETLLFRARRALREQMEGPVACGEVESLLLLQMDGTLGADDRRRLRAHTRACTECATLERRHRGRRAALKRLGSGITLPPSLSSFFGSGGGSVAGGAAAGIGAKIAAVAIATVTAASVGVVESKRASGSGNTASAPEVLVEAAPAASRVASTPPAAGTLHVAAVRSAAAQRPRTASTIGASTQGRGAHVGRKSRRQAQPTDASTAGADSAAAPAGDSAAVVAISASAANAPAAPSVRGGTATVRSQVRNATSTLPRTVKHVKNSADTAVKAADDTVKQSAGTVTRTADETVAKTVGTVDQTVGTVTKTVDDTVGTVVATAPVSPPVTIPLPAVQLPVPPLPTPKPVLPAPPPTPPLPIVPAVPTPVPVALPALPAPPQPPALPVPKK